MRRTGTASWVAATLLSVIFLIPHSARPADGPLPDLPPHLLESGIPTRGEVTFAETWLNTITANLHGKLPPDPWLGDWIGTELPFRFRYGDQEFASIADRCQRSVQTTRIESGVEARTLSWSDPATGLKVTWQVRRFVEYPALDSLLVFENTGRKDTAIVEGVQNLSLRMNHAREGQGHMVHGAHGGRCGRDDLMAFSLPVREAPDDVGPVLSLLRQDYEQLEKNRSILKAPLVIGQRQFEHGLGTHSVSRIQVRSPKPIEGFSAWIGVDHNPRTRGGAGSVVFSVKTDQSEVFRSGILRGGQGPVRVDVKTKGTRVLSLDVDDAGDGPTCDHADWAEAMIRMEGGTSVRLDELSQLPSNAVQLGSTGSSSNHELPFFNIESPEGRGVLVGLGWTGNWRAGMAVEGRQLHAQAGLPVTRFRLHPGEKVRGPRVLLLLWSGKRLHGHNMLRRLLYEHYLPPLPGPKPHRPLVSVNVCFTYHGKGGYLEQATEKAVLAIVQPFIQLGAESFVIDAGYYNCKSWGDIGQTKDYSFCRERFPRGFQPIAEPLGKAGVAFGLWFVPEVFGAMGDGQVRKRFLAVVDDYVKSHGMTMYRQDGGGTPGGDGTDRLGIPEMQHIAGLYAIQDELRRRYPAMVMEGCCGGGRRIDLESLSRFHWHQKSDQWFDTLSDHCGLYGANLFLPGGVINVPTEAVDDFGLWSSFGGQLCLAWHPLDKSFPMEKAKRQVALYKRVRGYLSGDFYPLTECTLEIPWLAYQFHQQGLGEGFALVFRRNAGGGPRFALALRGLEPQARYEVELTVAGTKTEYAGSRLAQGIAIVSEATPYAELAIYRRTAARQTP